jgi:hypothetical protein
VRRKILILTSVVIVLWVLCSRRSDVNAVGQESPRTEKRCSPPIPEIPLVDIRQFRPPLRVEPADMHYDLSPVHPLPQPVAVEFRLREWELLRRDVTLWGITFSLGQPSWPLIQGEEPSAEVLSFPLHGTK